MCLYSAIVKNISKILLLHIIHINVGIFLVLHACRFPETKAFPSGVHVAGYQEENVPIYPFQQYIQVRKKYTVEHVPLYEDQPSHKLQASASNSHHGSSNDHQGGDDDREHGSGGNHYYVPRLREEVSDYKKQEVYEEKGYGDSDYDHHYYKEPTRHSHYDDNNEDGTESSSASNVAHSTGHQHRPYRHQSRHSLHTPDGQSTKILEYVANNLHDGDAHRQGIYAARSNIYCPEVIDFDLSSKSMGMGKGVDRKAKPRLHGLGSKILCLKNKYFGAEPLPKAIFAEPSESKESAIEVPSFSNFFNMVRQNVDSYSSFQNSNVPI